jgi:hypothetical protein
MARGALGPLAIGPATDGVKMTKSLKTTKKNGELYYSVPVTARLLKMRPAGVKKLMGEGKLDWDQTRLNGQSIVRAKSVAAYLRSSVARRT